MEFIKNIRSYQTDPEIRMYRQEEMTVPHMVSKESEVEPDENGRKIIPLGTLVDKDGKPCKISQSGEITGTPVGITHDTKDVTYSNQEVAVYIHGHLKGPMLQFEGEEYQEAIGKAIEKALPGIYVYPRTNGPLDVSGSSASSTVNFDLSKATGTLGIDKGGTGATSASEALSALLESQPLSIENGGTGKGTANEALDALLESQPLSVENGGTGATSEDAALEALGGQKKLSDPLPIANGGTGATTAEQALTNLGAQKAAE